MNLYLGSLTTLEIWQVAAFAFIILVALQVTLYVLLYRRPRIDESLVRTGLGEVRVAVNAGIFVLPFVHKIKRVSLVEHKLEYTFEGPHALRWQGGERFEGSIIVTAQIPAENTTLLTQAARALFDTSDTQKIAELLEGVYRASSRDMLRSVRRITFDIEPAAVEMRLTQALDLASNAFGLRVRAVYLYDKVTDTGRIRRAMAHIAGFTPEPSSGGQAESSGSATEQAN